MPISNSVREVLKRSSGQHQCYKDHCFAVVLYSICYSVISPCTNINVHVDEVGDGELGNLTISRISLETLILRNHTKIKRNVRL